MDSDDGRISHGSRAGRASPQRYVENRKRYMRRPNALDTDGLLEGFVAGNPANAGDLARFYFFCLAFDQIIKESVEGDLAELGVYKGNTALLLAAAARRLGTTAWLFDTYEGFAASDLEGIDADKKLEFADTSLEAVRGLVGEQNVRFVKGYFPDTTSAVPADQKFCMVHIDCDLYAPFRSALNFFYERLVPGGFLIMHDYSSLHWDGAEKAVDEFFCDKPECVVPLPDSAGTVTMRKARPTDSHTNWYAGRRNSGFARVWVNLGQDNAADLLHSGWSNQEDWGVWGVGPSHKLELYLAYPAHGVLQIEADVEAALIGSRSEQQVDVWSDGRIIGVWTFTRELNRGIRSVCIPIPSPDDVTGLPSVVVEFRPKFFEAPAEIDGSKYQDARPLGLGLRRLRQWVRSDVEAGPSASSSQEVISAAAHSIPSKRPALLDGLPAPVVGLCTGSGRTLQDWPLDRFRDLAIWLYKTIGGSVVLLGEAGQSIETRLSLDSGQSDRRTSLVRTASSAEAIAVLAHLDLYIGIDSALTRHAARQGVPCVAILSGVDATSAWERTESRVRFVRTSMGCSPCHLVDVEDCRHAHGCMSGLSLTAVKNAVRSILMKIAPDAPRGSSPVVWCHREAQSSLEDAS